MKIKKKKKKKKKKRKKEKRIKVPKGKAGLPPKTDFILSNF